MKKPKRKKKETPYALGDLVVIAKGRGTARMGKICELNFTGPGCRLVGMKIEF